MSAQGKAVNALNEGLALVVNAGGSLDKAERLVHAEACIRGVLRMLEATPQEDHTCPAGSLSLTLPDGSQIDAVELAQPGMVVGIMGDHFGPGSQPGSTLNTVDDDEIDEDPPRLFAIDADDPDGGRNTIPVEALAGCHVMIVEDAESAAVIDARYRAENDSDVGEQGPEQA